MRAVLTLSLFTIVLGVGGAATAQQRKDGSTYSRAIYSCVDSQGKRHTADRPIAECLDREQKEYKKDGTVRRVHGPWLTAAERAAQEERERKLAEDRQRAADEQRMNKALLARYPRQSAHDAERAKALHAVDESIAGAEHRLQEIRVARAQLKQEGELHRAPELWPAKLKRQFEENHEQEAVQQRHIAGQQEERKRVNARFDEELARLKPLWSQRGTGAAPAAAVPVHAPVRRP